MEYYYWWYAGFVNRERRNVQTYIHTYIKKKGEEDRRRKEREEIRRDEKRDENNCRMCCDVHWICKMEEGGRLNGNVAGHDYRHNSLQAIEYRGTAGTMGQDGENCIMWSFTCCDLVAGKWPAY